MKYSLAAIVSSALILGGAMIERVEAAVPVVWDGSDTSPDHHVIAPGYLRWEEGNWTRDGGTPGQTATAALTTVIGQNQDGNTGGRGGLDIVIGGGAKVFHDQNDGTTDPGALGDFKPRMDLNGNGSLTIKEGAVLWLDSHTDVDGRWFRVGINGNLDNGTIRTTHTPALCPPSECSDSAGRIIFGYQNELLPNTAINWNLTNGGRIEMEGKMIFGNPDFHDANASTGHNPGIGVNMTINNGTLDLTGGRLYADFFGLVNGELVFFYEWNEVTNQPKNEQYVIDFTGPGQIIVDSAIFVTQQGADGVFNPVAGTPDLYESLTYEDLWDLGILRANGQSGMTGATFSNFFSVTGAPDAVDEFGNVTVDNNDYTLTSLLVPPGLDGDHNEDGVVDAADYVAWRKDPGSYGGDPGGYNEWRTNFGDSAPGSGGAVPEPASFVLVTVAFLGFWTGCRACCR